MTCDTTTLDFRIRRTDGSAEWNLGADVTDYEEELLPAVDKVARAGRLLYIAVDT